MATVVTFEHRGRGIQGIPPLTLVVILDDADLEKMRAGDPYHMPPEASADFAGHAIGQLQIVVAYEADKHVIMEFRESGDRDGLLTYLERGRAGIAR